MRRVSHLRPWKDITRKDLDDTFIKVEHWDPYFWEKVTHVVTDSYWKGNEFCTHFEYYMKANEVLGQLDAGQGYVYILVSDQQTGICKIGSTERTPEERITEINRATGVILPWRLYDAVPCKAPRAVEHLVHKILAESRIDQRKEGFAVNPEVARNIILKVISDNTENFLVKNHHVRYEDNIS